MRAFSHGWLRSATILILMLVMLLTSVLINVDAKTAHAAASDTSFMQTLEHMFQHYEGSIPQPKPSTHSASVLNTLPLYLPHNLTNASSRQDDSPPLTYLIAVKNPPAPSHDYRNDGAFKFTQTLWRSFTNCIVGGAANSLLGLKGQGLVANAVVTTAWGQKMLRIALYIAQNPNVDQVIADLVADAGGAAVVSNILGIVVNFLLGCVSSLIFYAVQALADMLNEWTYPFKGDINNPPQSAVDDAQKALQGEPTDPARLCTTLDGTWISGPGKTGKTLHSPTQGDGHCDMSANLHSSLDGTESDPTVVAFLQDVKNDPAVSALASCDNDALQQVYPFEATSYNQDTNVCTFMIDATAAIAYNNINGTTVAAAFCSGTDDGQNCTDAQGNVCLDSSIDASGNCGDATLADSPGNYAVDPIYS